MAITLDRNLDSLTAIELKKNTLIAVPMLYLDFPTLIKYYSGSTNQIILKSSAIMPAATYSGVGGISSVSASEEAVELRATKLTVELNGLDSSYMALVLAEQYYGRDAILGLATLDSNYSIIGEPLVLFKGFMSILSITLDSKTAVTVEIESILADWERPRVKRYNTGTQALIDPTDKGFDNVSDNITKELVWGK